MTNLASNRAAYQSDFKGYFDMAHLVTDGQKETQWTSPFVDNEWMYIDLGKSYDINRIIIYWGENYGEEYKLLVSTDKFAWQEIFHQKKGKGKKERITFPTVKGRYVKFQGIKGKPNSGFMIAEMEIYGESSEESTVKPMTIDHSFIDGTLYLDKRWKLQQASSLKSDGKIHSTSGYNDERWFPAVVPGTVLTTYIENQAVPDLYYGNQQFFISELFSRSVFWYRTEFNLPGTFKDKTVWLNFDGINYKAEIFVNGEKTGEIKGAFIRGCFDITPFVRFDKINAIAVLIHPVEHPGIPSIQDLTTPGANGGMLTQDGPTFICSAGWDWIPTIPDRNIGIWQPVYVSTSGPVTIKDPFVITDLPLPDTSKADVTVKTYIVNHSAIKHKGKIKGQIDDASFEKEVTLARGEEKEIVFRSTEFPQLVLENPKLWWPNTYGEQPLYTLDLEFLQENGSVSHRMSRYFGVREFSYDFPHELVISVNGVPVFIKGGGVLMKQ
jgi:hypothetical protein